MAIISAGSIMVPDKQILVQFHQYLDLPAELRIKIIHEFIAGLREQIRLRRRSLRPLPFGKFAPFAVIHSEWQYEFEAEQELFGSLCLSTDDLSAYHAMLNQHRRAFLSKLTAQIHINNAAIKYNPQIDHMLGNAGIRSRVGGIIVNSMATILDGVAYGIQNGSQATRAGLELCPQFIVPRDKDHHRLRVALNLRDGIHCDFSQLPPLHTIRRFSQQRPRDSQLLALGHPLILYLSPPSLLSLVRRMPNLEQAVAGISRWSFHDVSSKFKFTSPKCSRQPWDLYRNRIGFEEGMSALMIDIAPQRNSFPRLKTLKIPFQSEMPCHTLARWASSWGNTIENLETCSTYNVPVLLRRLFKREEHSGSTAWPNLRVLKVRGYCFSRSISTSAPALTAPGGPIETLCAMAVVLAWLPSIKDITVKLRLLVGSQDEPTVVIRLHLCSRSSKLTTSRPIPHPSGGILSNAFWSGSSESGELSFEDQLHNAAAEVQAAVRMHRGRDLEILWTETVEEPHSQCPEEYYTKETSGRRGHNRLIYFGFGGLQNHGGVEVVTSQQ